MFKLVSTKIGKTSHHFMFEGINMFECTQEAYKHMFRDIPECGECHSDNLELRAYSNNNYLKVMCLDCGAELVLTSKREEPNVHFPRRYKEGEKEGVPKGTLKWEHYKKRD